MGTKRNFDSPDNPIPDYDVELQPTGTSGGDGRIDVPEERLRRELGTSVYLEPFEEEEE